MKAALLSVLFAVATASQAQAAKIQCFLVSENESEDFVYTRLNPEAGEIGSLTFDTKTKKVSLGRGTTHGSSLKKTVTKFKRVRPAPQTEGDAGSMKFRTRDARVELSVPVLPSGKVNGEAGNYVIASLFQDWYDESIEGFVSTFLCSESLLDSLNSGHRHATR